MKYDSNQYLIFMVSDKLNFDRNATLGILSMLNGFVIEPGGIKVGEGSLSFKIHQPEKEIEKYDVIIECNGNVTVKGNIDCNPNLRFNLLGNAFSKTDNFQSSVIINDPSNKKAGIYYYTANVYKAADVSKCYEFFDMTTLKFLLKECLSESMDELEKVVDVSSKKMSNFGLKSDITKYISKQKDEYGFNDALRSMNYESINKRLGIFTEEYQSEILPVLFQK